MRINCKFITAKEREMMGLTNNKVKTMKITKSNSRKKQQRSLRRKHQCSRS